MNATPQTWQEAKKYAQKLGLVPSSFSTAIRMLLVDHKTSRTALQPVTKYQIARLMRGPSFKSMLYFASAGLRSEKMKSKKSVNIGEMLDLFEPGDIAGMIATYLIYRKWRKLLPADLWKQLAPFVDLESGVGCQIGSMIPKIGVFSSLIASSFPYLALGAVMGVKPDAAREYVRTCKQGERLAFNPKLETEKFGCPLEQVAALLMLGVGLGADVSEGFTQSCDISLAKTKPQQSLAYQMYMYRLWSDAIFAGKDQPATTISGDFFPLAAARTVSLGAVAELRKGAVQNWLSKGKSDISKESTPLLFTTTIVEGAEEIPEGLADIFSMNEITGMDVDEFDKLCDQMDDEAEGKTKPGGTSLSAKDLSALQQMVD